MVTWLGLVKVGPFPPIPGSAISTLARSTSIFSLSSIEMAISLSPSLTHNSLGQLRPRGERSSWTPTTTTKIHFPLQLREEALSWENYGCVVRRVRERAHHFMQDGVVTCTVHVAGFCFALFKGTSATLSPLTSWINSDLDEQREVRGCRALTDSPGA
ncbi:hypothetical protein BgiMline_018669 [Biomphalaria glabrata]|nr:hypothetical protein BgiMline_006276 [Biomphalaria glabrata]